MAKEIYYLAECIRMKWQEYIAAVYVAKSRAFPDFIRIVAIPCFHDFFFFCVTGVELVTLSEPKQSSDEWTILRRWDVPWEWQTVMLTMVGCGVR